MTSNNKSINLIILALVLGFLHACNVLEQDPVLDIDSEKAITNKGGAVAALLGAYSELQNNSYYGRDYVAFSYLSSGEAEWSGTYNQYQQFIQHNIVADNNFLAPMWVQIYRVINTANHLIAKVPQIEDRNLTDAERSQILGEAYFLRALAYFDLGRAWGGVPLVLNPTETKNDGADIGRATLEATYAQVLADLDKAEDLLAPLTVRTRASQEAAKALKARLFLYQGNWEQAEQLATAVIESNRFSLVAPYKAFINDKETEESIFELSYNNADRNNHAHYGFPSSLGGRYEWHPSDQLLAELTDPAIGGNRGETISYLGSNPYSTKYFRIGSGDDPAYILRIAEQYLLRAEARVKKGTPNLIGAVADLNQVRNRAGLAPLDLTNAEDILLAIEQERRLEFAFEGHQWFDLIRTGRAGAVLGLTESNKYLYPIPLNEIIADDALNPEDQNPGY
ncbi:MAG TPA: RagB/SusD family nutrient uptake outer membrane protein [Cyclobacteriaceae bacterium]|nr:RagB/SusD family nutrient uptake outer membrane protein [Cyclobacteriaceae bacterium]